MNIVRIAALCSTAIALTFSAQAEEVRSFVASGHGLVLAKPDVVFVSIGFKSEGKTPDLAIAADAGLVNKVTAVFVKAGIAARDIQTENYTIKSVEGPEGCGYRYGDQPPVPCVIEGFAIENTMTLRIRDLNQYGNILTAAIGAGLSDIRNITLDVFDPEPLRQQAYALALEDARAKAELTARTLGFTLGPIIDVGANFQEPVTFGRPDPRPATLADGIIEPAYYGDGEGAADLTVMVLQPGEVTFSKDASITYAIIP